MQRARVVGRLALAAASITLLSKLLAGPRMAGEFSSANISAAVELLRSMFKTAASERRCEIEWGKSVGCCWACCATNPRPVACSKNPCVSEVANVRLEGDPAVNVGSSCKGACRRCTKAACAAARLACKPPRY